jgi:hypothetical protein
LHSYSSIYNVGHRALEGLFDGPVIVEEKIDGSQFSFGVFDGVLRVRSKGADVNLEAPEKMFAAGVGTVIGRNVEGLLTPGWTYRGEYLSKPKHNALAYDRIPRHHVILFDIDRGDQDYLAPERKAIEAEHVGLEVVPELYRGMVTSAEFFRSLLETPSVLGGQKVEGVVIKPVGYGIYGPDKKVLMGKFVSEAFKETHSKAWSDANPGGKDIVAILQARLGTQARWQKAVQHLREDGQIEDDPRDIGKLFKEVNADVLKECRDEILDELFKWAWPKIARGITRGLPDWYKDSLLRSQFKEEA